MSGKRPVVYWDSSTFLALIKKETHHRDKAYETALSQAESFDRGEIVLATSTVGVAEVLAADLTEGQREHFEGMIRRSNFLTVNLTEAIARCAAAIRGHCHREARKSSGDPYLLAMPDAFHVASAVLIEAEVLVTLDEKNKVNMARERELGMSQVTQYYPIPGLKPIRIERPSLGQPGTGLF